MSRLDVIRSKALQHPDIIFAIRRSLNDNLCVYQLNRDSRTGQLNTESPIQVYWLDVDNNSSHGYRRSLLTHLEERTAYGIQIDKRPSVDPTDKSRQLVSFHIRAIPDISITGAMEPKSSCAYADIDNHTCQIHNVFVQLGGLLNHKVKNVRVNGVDRNGKHRAEEHHH
jgi:hypothetical protein